MIDESDEFENVKYNEISEDDESCEDFKMMKGLKQMRTESISQTRDILR